MRPVCAGARQRVPGGAEGAGAAPCLAGLHSMAAATALQHAALRGTTAPFAVTNSNAQYTVTHFWPELTYHG